jgi:hypothetical protein
MTKGMTLRLDRFGQDALEEYVRGTGGSHAVALRTAARYYLDDAERGRPAWRVPRPARAAPFAGTLEVEVDDVLYKELEREAVSQDVAPELLAAHAVLYYLADLDTGRAAARLGDALGRDAEAK